MNTAVRILVVSLAFAALGCETAGRSTAPASTRTVTVGALLPLTGSLASYGESSRAALAEAVAAINARGGARLTLDAVVARDRDGRRGRLPGHVVPRSHPVVQRPAGQRGADS